MKSVSCRKCQGNPWRVLVIPVMTLLALWVPTSSGSSSEPYYTYADDASWAIQSLTVSNLLSNDKQLLYNNYIKQCNLAALEDQKRDGDSKLDFRVCSFNDERRLRMNRLQPGSVYNYTTRGFGKIRAPPKLFQMIRDFYEANKNQSSIEWSSVNPYQNLWDIPSTIVRLENEDLIGGGEELKQRIWAEAQGILEEWTGQPLAPVSLYGIREYHRGSILVPHVDRMPLITSAIINVDQQGIDEPWVLEVYGHDGKATNITMEVGDMILYESHSVIHGRPFPFQGELYANVFLHFEPNETTHYDPKVGLPPYIIPGSEWETYWREDYPNGWLAENGDGSVEPSAARDAVWSGDVEALRDLAKEDPDLLHEPDDNGWHPLHEAVRTGNVEIVKVLLDHGADVNQETYSQQNPLWVALQSHGPDHEMTKFLLEMGAIDAGPDL